MNNDKILKYCLKLELRLKSMEDLLKIKYQNFNNKRALKFYEIRNAVRSIIKVISDSFFTF